MDVTNPKAFAESPGAAEAVQETIAANAGVTLDEVYVNITYVEAGLLLFQQAKQPVDEGTVKIEYKIIQEFAEGEEEEAESSSNEVVASLNAVDASAWTTEISDNVAKDTAVNYTLVVSEVPTVPAPVITETVIVPTTTTTTKLVGFEFVGDGLAKAKGCSNCAPNYYQQTYESINSINLPYMCGLTCSLAPCCFGYSYTLVETGGVYFCNIYTTNSSVWDGWTLYPNDYYSIGGTLSGTTGMTYKKTDHPLCPPASTTLTTTSSPLFPGTTPGV